MCSKRTLESTLFRKRLTRTPQTTDEFFCKTIERTAGTLFFNGLKRTTQTTDTFFCATIA